MAFWCFLKHWSSLIPDLEPCQSCGELVNFWKLEVMEKASLLSEAQELMTSYDLGIQIQSVLMRVQTLVRTGYSFHPQAYAKVRALDTGHWMTLLNLWIWVPFPKFEIYRPAYTLQFGTSSTFAMIFSDYLGSNLCLNCWVKAAGHFNRIHLASTVFKVSFRFDQHCWTIYSTHGHLCWEWSSSDLGYPLRQPPF